MALLLFQGILVLNSLEHFNQYYQNEIHPVAAESLSSFFQTVVAPRLKPESCILDLGSGSLSIFEKLQIKNVTAIDFSPEAIKKSNPDSEVKYIVKNLAVEDSLSEARYDLVFDSHCLHCLTDISERQIAFKNILHSMKGDGIFAAEMMVQAGKSQTTLPFKYIPDAFSLENELLQAGLKIKYFMILRDLKFYNENGECDLVRVIAEK